MQINIHFARDTDGRWVAEIPEFTGAVGFGANKAEAKAAALVMAREISIAELKDSEPRTVTSGVCSQELCPRRNRALAQATTAPSAARAPRCTSRSIHLAT